MDMALPSAAMDGTDLRDVLKSYIATSERMAEKAGPFAAEIAPERAPAWYLLTTQPASESLAASHLVGRRFGTYLPTFWADVTLPNSGLCRAGRPMFPGYLFAFVWDIFRHWRRIHGCPGVRGVLTVDDQPVIVPDSVIGDLQVIEAINGDLTKMECRAAKRGFRRRRRQQLAARMEIAIYPKGSKGGGF